LVFFGDRNAPATNVNSFAGNGVNSMDGALYFPSQEVDIAGNGVAAAPCTQLIAKTIMDTGNGTFANGCSGLGTANIGGSATKIVE
jgi:hypothetical protein